MLSLQQGNAFLRAKQKNKQTKINGSLFFAFKKFSSISRIFLKRDASGPDTYFDNCKFYTDSLKEHPETHLCKLDWFPFLNTANIRFCWVQELFQSISRYRSRIDCPKWERQVEHCFHPASLYSL